jgi:pimeloyl-ACP methyl ester carboxylesterase
MSTFTTRGRAVEVHDLTPDAGPDAPLVLLCHAAPGSGAFDPDPEVTAARGIRLLSLDRPGYGGSEPLEDEFATVGSAADDAADLLGNVLPDGATAGVAGWSAGGRVALALAAPDQEVPWYGDENRAMVDALRGLPPADATAQLTAVFEGMLGTGDADDGALMRLAGIADADADVLTPPVRARLRTMLDVASAQGVTGVVADLAGYTLAEWGFAPAQVAAEVLLAYGADDALVPPAHGEWYRAQLPSAELRLWPGVGHLVVVPVWSQVLDHLLSA